MAAKKAVISTYGGGSGSKGKTPEEQLRRFIGANLLFDNQAYAGADSMASAFLDALNAASPELVAELAIESADKYKLRHAPLFMAASLANRKDTPKGLLRGLLPRIISRPDEMVDAVKIWAGLSGVDVRYLKGRLPAQIKRGLSDSYPKFDAYQLGKYDRKDVIGLRDIAFLTHPKPASAEQAEYWKQFFDGELAAPDTWEVALSTGKDKRETFERLITEGKLGDLAFLRNLRNMVAAGVSGELIKQQLNSRAFHQILPFQFLAAAKYASQFESELGEAMLRSMSGMDKLTGSTCVIVDVSGSMQTTLANKGETLRLDAAAALAVLLVGVSEQCTVIATGDKSALLPAVTGMNLVKAIHRAPSKVGYGGIYTELAVKYVRDRVGSFFDRVVIITDEQDCGNGSPSDAPLLGRYNYILNVGSYDVGLDLQNGWEVVSGFSEQSVKFIKYYEDES